jgi:hypothetical protein
MHHQADQEKHKEQKEKNLGNSSERDSDTAVSHNGCYERYQKEHQCVIEHLRIPP